jgi:hypothetical protein
MRKPSKGEEYAKNIKIIFDGKTKCRHHKTPLEKPVWEKA